MPSASFTITVERPADHVFAYVADLRHGPEWFDMIDRVELVGGGEPGTVGAHFQVAAERAVFDDIVMDYRTAEVEPGRRVVFAVGHPKLEGTDTFVLTPEGTATEVTYTTDVTMKGLNKLATPFMSGGLEHAATKAGPQLKAALERS